MDKRKGSGNEAISAEQAEDLKMKEKRKREREVFYILQLYICHVSFFLLIFIDMKLTFLQKNMPRKQRRKLEAAREMLEDEDEVKVHILSFFVCLYTPLLLLFLFFK